VIGLMNPAIVINAYNRPRSLARLLRTVQTASYPLQGSIPLIISLDDAVDHPDVAAIAENFEWKCGPKEIIRRERKLGLKRHFYACGDLSEIYGAIIYLEDDLLVSPVYYLFTAQVLDFYRADEHVAGISLYQLWFNGYNRQPFTPYLDKADTFFMQLPYTQGEAFTSEQWKGYRLWQSGTKDTSYTSQPIHESWSHFDPDDWFPEWTAYLVKTGRFFVFPRSSLSTGMGDAGTHFTKVSQLFQAPLLHEKNTFQLKSLEESNAVYDSFFEILPSRLNRLTDCFHEYDYCVDLYATRTKANISAEYVLTSRLCTSPLFSFAKSMRPLEANVIEAIDGQGISFCKKESLRWDWLSELKTNESNRAYFSHGQHPSLRGWARSKFARLLKKP
jgi:hypothetical protein